PTTLSSPPENARQPNLHIEIRIDIPGPSLDSDYPYAAVFQLIYQWNQIVHSRDPHIFDRAGRSLRHRFVQSGGAVFGDEDAVNSSALARPQNGAQVMRVFDAIEQHDQRGIAHRIQNLLGLDVSVLPIERRDESDHALVIRGARQVVQNAPVSLFDRHPRATRGFDQFVQPRWAPARRDQNFVNRAAARSQSFEHRREAVNLIHLVDQPQYSIKDTGKRRGFRRRDYIANTQAIVCVSALVPTFRVIRA